MRRLSGASQDGLGFDPRDVNHVIVAGDPDAVLLVRSHRRHHIAPVAEALRHGGPDIQAGQLGVGQQPGSDRRQRSPPHATTASGRYAAIT